MPIELLMKLPKPARVLWEKTYESATAKYGETQGAKVAWGVVRDKFHKVENTWVARVEDFVEFTTTKFVFQADEDSLVRTDDGHYTRDFIIASSNSVRGVSLSPVALKRFAEQINSEKVKGRLDEHAYLSALKKAGLTPEQIEVELAKIDEGIEAVQAIAEGDKLRARIVFTPEAYEKAREYKAASIEARYPTEAVRDGVLHQARLTGFVLTNTPADEAAVEI